MRLGVVSGRRSWQDVPTGQAIVDEETRPESKRANHDITPVGGVPIDHGLGLVLEHPTELPELFQGIPNGRQRAPQVVRGEVWNDRPPRAPTGSWPEGRRTRSTPRVSSTNRVNVPSVPTSPSRSDVSCSICPSSSRRISASRRSAQAAGCPERFARRW